MHSVVNKILQICYVQENSYQWVYAVSWSSGTDRKNKKKVYYIHFIIMADVYLWFSV